MNLLRNNTCSRRFSLGALTLAAGLLLASTAQAETQAWTGCVTPGGTIIHMARGDTPTKSCAMNQRIIHLRNEDAVQNPSANYDQAAVCEAFHALNLNADALAKLDCPSTTDPIVLGIVTPSQLSGKNLEDKNFNVCGILKSETRDSWHPYYHWVIPGGFVASTDVLPHVPGDDSRDVCRQKCVDDEKCIAANFKVEEGFDYSGTCRTFHHSEALIAAGSEWDSICGLAQGFSGGGLPVGCGDRLDEGGAVDSWYIRHNGPNLDQCTPQP